ncbi:TM2 domain-containing protein [Arthrobacter sp. HLT1-20]
MSENSQPEQPATPAAVPAGYDKPATPQTPEYQAPTVPTPAYQAPAAPAETPVAPAYPQASQAPMYPQPGAQAGYDQQNVQAGYPQPGVQQNYGQPGYGQQPAYGMQYGAEQKSKIVAGILGILLGSLGIHRFYLGDTKMGVIQIVVTFVTFGLGGIWGFIEGIMILVGADPFKTDAKGIPLKD